MAKADPEVKAGCGAIVRSAILAGMRTAEDQKQARLAQALRENLRRRKAQAREGDGAAPPPPSTPDRD